ncbi:MULTISPECIES: OsmC family protein [Chromohalobacter]|uniref:OsmC family protein n=1 Tax=Chromohalobacter TaxID=42054 RepID=UPI000D715D34|nr:MULTISPECIES: OsmC family protein [Chromohalobacter]MDO0944585.1 OsmC family protein [Chromohalobacter salexigens]NQY44835.1 OsmC family protein [Chromohalobacter sp.]PWW34465.1 osmotically inducible protein OsmC [Chromohalobacter salexigens]RXE47696.1 OsmC family peroxiredoxin [Chromohalobacter salexigens]
MSIEKTGSAHWQGSLKRGKGTVSTQSGALKDNPYGFNTRFEGEPGTNPEELIAASHASCYSMALSMILGEAGHDPDDVRTEATVTLDKDDSGFKVTKVDLVTRAKVPGIDQAGFDDAAQKAKEGCPISRLLNAEITLDARLEG